MLRMDGTSHLKNFSSKYPHPIIVNGKKTTKFENKLPGVNQCNSFGGLTLMDKHFERDSLQPLADNPENQEHQSNKNKQLNKFIRGIQNGTEKATLFVTLSNDYKYFLTNHKGSMLSLTRTAKSKWDKLSAMQKSKYDIYKHNPLTGKDRTHIYEQIGKYENKLKEIFQKSSLEIFFQSSVLERFNPKIKYLPLYFAILNSVLKHEIYKWDSNETFKNKFGKSIKCKFVCVRKQFYLNKPNKIFIPKEIRQGKELTHRTDKALDSLMDTWYKQLTNAKFS